MTQINLILQEIVSVVLFIGIPFVILCVIVEEIRSIVRHCIFREDKGSSSK